MNRSRRRFLIHSSAGFLSAAVAGNLTPDLGAQQTPAPAPGTPPAFGTAPAVGPEVSAATFADAEKLARVEMTEKDRAQAASNWRESMAPLYERRTGPRKVALETEIQPWSRVQAVRPGQYSVPERDRFIRSESDPGPLPPSDEDIAYAPIHKLSRWIEKRQLTSTRLTKIYLDRLRRFDPKLHCVITLTADHALDQASRADQEIAAGKVRGPLHGIPWGAKDLLDTANIPTTYGAEPFRDRVPAKTPSSSSASITRAPFSSPSSASARSPSTTSGSAARPSIPGTSTKALPARAPVRARRLRRASSPSPSAVKPTAASSVPACAAASPDSAPPSAVSRAPAPWPSAGRSTSSAP
jgi:Amidase